MNMIKTIIIVPCFNEAARLNGQAFLDFTLKHPHIGILFVNDGSTDTTGNMLDYLAQQAPKQIFYLHLNKNYGKAEAVRQGFLKGFSWDVELIGYIDADLSAPLSCMLELEKLLDDGQKEVAMGARVKMLGRDIRRSSIRHLVGRIFATVVSVALHLPLYDSQCGAKLFRKTSRLERIFSFPFTVRWIFDVEILARFIALDILEGNQVKLKEICVEYPLQAWEAQKGSKLKYWDFVISFFDLMNICYILKTLNKGNNLYRRQLLRG